MSVEDESGANSKEDERLYESFSKIFPSERIVSCRVDHDNRVSSVTSNINSKGSPAIAFEAGMLIVFDLSKNSSILYIEREFIEPNTVRKYELKRLLYISSVIEQLGVEYQDVIQIPNGTLEEIFYQIQVANSHLN